MDDYRDVADNYRRTLEKIILDAGLRLPSIYGIPFSKRERAEHDERVTKIREKEGWR